MNKTTLLAATAAFAVATGAAFTAEATAVVPGDYAKSFTITFPGYAGSETLTDFPVLVKVSPARNNFDYSACKVPNGGDLRFADAEGNLLASEVDTWNTSGESLVWVKVPSFSKSTVITAYYGNATPDAVTASDVWANGYVGVWHLNETGVPLADSSGRATSFVLPASTQDRTTYATNGVAGGKSVSFDNAYYGDVNYNRLVAADAPVLRGLTNFTVECWTYQTRYRDDGDATIIGTLYNWKLYQEKNSGILASRWRRPDGGSITNVFGAKTTSGLALNEWTHSTLVRNFTGVSSADSTLYLNGGSVATKSESNAIPTGNGNIITNSLGSADGLRVFPGSIDEVRVSNVARSADWVKASHDCVTEEGFAAFAVVEKDNDWTEYSHRFRVLFSGYTGSETLVNFPVLVKISESGVSGFRYADCQKPGGADLRFADEGGSLLASEVDTWNTNGVSLVWVKVPSLTAATKITAYYGWDLAPEVAASNVWANGYVGVWHLNEAAVPLKESSGVSSPFTEGAKPQYVDFGASGIIGKSVDFGSYTNNNFGSSRLHAADVDGHLSGFTNFTVECWTYQTKYWKSGSAGAAMLSKGEGDNRTWKVYQECSANNYSQLEFVDAGGNRASRVISSSAAPSGKWTHQTFIRNKTGLNNCLLYFNGEEVGRQSDTRNSFKSSTEPLILGGGTDNVEGTSRVFPGSIDEVRISNVARSADWVKASHDTVTESSFATYGAAGENADTATIISFR